MASERGGGRGNLKGNAKGGRGGAPPRAPGSRLQRSSAILGAGFEKGLPSTEWGRKTRDDRKANNSKDNPTPTAGPSG